jgi:hypothetical protein
MHYEEKIKLRSNNTIHFSAFWAMVTDINYVPAVNMPPDYNSILIHVENDCQPPMVSVF